MRRPAATLVDDAESLVSEAAHAGKDDIAFIREMVGGRGFGKVKLTPDDKALLQVPLYFVFGNAADTDEQGNPLALAYWRPIYAAGGKAGVEAHDREMRGLIKTKSPEWLQYLTPDQVATLKDFIARGLHSGWLRGQDGADATPDARLSVAGQTTGAPPPMPGSGAPSVLGVAGGQMQPSTTPMPAQGGA